MKTTFLYCLFLLLAYSGFSQEQGVIRVNPLKENEEELTKQVYKYPSFTNGIVYFKDNATAEAKMNYNRLSGQILFIGTRGDTLAFAHPETFNKVAIGQDTFFYYEKGFLELLTHDPSVNLAKRQTIKYIGQEKSGAYGSYSTVTSVNSSNLYSTDEKMPMKLEIDENSIFKFTNIYYLRDRFGNYFPASKKSFSDLFSHHEKELKNYLREHDINFTREKDLLKLIQYMQSLK
ncbi:MAG: hypothetical protein C4329_05805 [Chitinophagaceae bacterium]